jgi:hypothetical protein
VFPPTISCGCTSVVGENTNNGGKHKQHGKKQNGLLYIKSNPFSQEISGTNEGYVKQRAGTEKIFSPRCKKHRQFILPVFFG